MSSLAHSSGQETASIPTELVARLEAASVGSRELDAEICVALQYGGLNSEGGQNVRTDADWEGDLIYEIGSEECCCPIPPVTTSLDAALALAERVLPGVRVVTDSACKETAKPAAGFVFGQEGGRVNGVMSDGGTVALALCIAVLKATSASSVGILRQQNGPGNTPETTTTGEGGET